jgi:hypothetical protein
MATQAFEKLGLFYLGRVVDPQSASLSSDYFLYDARDLVTHAVCVGMTGSGKTGLCITLLEEAAIDGVPALIIDPKGDLGNLLLTFPGLSPQEFRPWVNEEEARKRDLSPEDYAAAEAERWRRGLAEWDQDADRIGRLRSAADFCIYTPGSTSGVPVSVTASFAAPPKEYLADPELLRDRIASTASGLLGLLGIQADPLKSREHILISNLLEQAWAGGRDATLGSLIQMIQSPPLARIGVFDLETFFPAGERLQLAMSLNNLLAAPGFNTWLDGEPLDVSRMLYTSEGRPRISIFSIAHLADAERMFFVTILLNQVLGWMRSQPGTGSLRAILYMDEIFGFFPPISEPPSKKPLLTLLKQARAYGLGVVLATQNPVDLDYKGLANTGTWFVGKLQTERDRERLLDGMAAASALAMGRDQLASTVAGLKQRQFLMHDIHEEKPVLFNSRWALSYLAGPLTRAQIKQLMQDRKSAAPGPAVFQEGAALAAPVPPAASVQTAVDDRPQVPAGIPQYFAPLRKAQPPGGRIVYQPHLYAAASYQIVDNKVGMSYSQSISHILPLSENMTSAPWDESSPFEARVEELSRQVPQGAGFSPVPTTILQASRFEKAQKGYLDFVYRQAQMTLWKSGLFKTTSQPGETERDFRLRLQQATRERRDFEIEKLRRKYAARIGALQTRLSRADQRMARETEQYGQQKVQAAISVGATIFGALLGRKAISASTLGRATTATRQASRILQEQGDVERAKEDRQAAQQQLQELERQMQQEADELARAFDPQTETLQPVIVRPSKTDILLRAGGVVWIPFARNPAGGTDPLW